MLTCVNFLNLEVTVNLSIPHIMNILSLFSHPHVAPNRSDFVSLVLVALFHALTLNDRWSFRALKMIQKHPQKSHTDDLCTLFLVFKSHMMKP